MIDSVKIYLTGETRSARNLALEAILTEELPANEASLMLWQNANAVIIGAGQNAWRECDIGKMERDKVTLTRRPSGGGAVFHDLGNLNFSFFMPRADYDVARQLGVIISAARAFGIEAQPTGRNDITVGGRKFSGNAFRLYRERAMHHGTILVSADMRRAGEYLLPDIAKLASKGVTSVRSRVANLSEFAAVSVPQMREALISEFQREYGAAEIIDIDSITVPGLAEREAQYASWDWNFARSPQGERKFEARFPFGGVQIYFSVLDGKMTGVSAYTDSMDETLANQITSALEGARFAAEEIIARLGGDIARGLIAEFAL